MAVVAQVETRLAPAAARPARAAQLLARAAPLAPAAARPARAAQLLARAVPLAPAAAPGTPAVRPLDRAARPPLRAGRRPTRAAMPPEAAAALQPGAAVAAAAWSQAGAPLKAAGQWPAVGMRERAASTVETQAREEAREPLAPHVMAQPTLFRAARAGPSTRAAAGQSSARAGRPSTIPSGSWCGPTSSTRTAPRILRIGATKRDSSATRSSSGTSRTMQRCRADCSPSPRRSNKS